MQEDESQLEVDSVEVLVREATRTGMLALALPRSFASRKQTKNMKRLLLLIVQTGVFWFGGTEPKDELSQPAIESLTSRLNSPS